MEDLWPDNFNLKDNIRTPSKILEEQGDILEKKTSGKIQGLLHQTKSAAMANDIMEYHFGIYSKTLNYFYSFMSIRHKIELYPVEITTDYEISKQLQWRSEKIEATNQSEFILLLSEIFKTDKVTQVIAAMFAQS
ncbi:hypothetical protein EHQ16_19350 [Leptospira kanakyensis]|uniref:Uncharacterized protein n=1 Tax=Leptospira kanakyensis TaxID=2484968 RepID=A0A6N4QHG7_9LEPT|nr:hypothetical protein [Leptospira kanakyensis]TGK51140.1 hypothetical protein EHQ11_09080 [Leptospira kanakyensis]TGK56366.1 hypothetical protein EHQ16_19350 [Leptospira kanakyensis]TGK71112.1 hypothetical protein EHQ18_08315 [Leptospira kanakyensis]